MNTTYAPKKKALLVGIQYSHSDYPLLGPTQDVLDLKCLLLAQYDYKAEDIVIMVDQSSDSTLLPTRANLLREIDNLVRDAQPGDHFLFHYSGHTGQAPNADGSELDGMDELIQTEDGNIIDDELKQRLIDPLPPKSSLIAILDSCHSETLLDLPHYYCNRVWTPFANHRDNSFRDKPIAAWRNRRMDAQRYTRSKAALSKRLSIDTSFLNHSAPLERSQTLTAFPAGVTSESPIEKPSSPDQWLSPRGRLPSRPMSRRSLDLLSHPFCRGPCLPDSHTMAQMPYVVAISACTDSQLAWENEKGESMTKAMINLLEAHPGASLGEVVLGISYKLYTAACKRRQTKEWRKYARSYEKFYGSKLNCYQHPSLSGLTQLDTNRHFHL